MRGLAVQGLSAAVNESVRTVLTDDAVSPLAEIDLASGATQFNRVVILAAGSTAMGFHTCASADFQGETTLPLGVMPAGGPSGGVPSPRLSGMSAAARSIANLVVSPPGCAIGTLSITGTTIRSMQSQRERAKCTSGVPLENATAAHCCADDDNSNAVHTLRARLPGGRTSRGRACPSERTTPTSRRGQFRDGSRP
mgnify:CR=1 FL=1